MHLRPSCIEPTNYFLLHLFWRFHIFAGDTVHLMSVTSTPYSANVQTTPSFVCLLSPPDTGLSHNIVTERYVLAGSMPTDDTLKIPLFSNVTDSNSIVLNLRASSSASQGVFYCELSNRELNTRVPVTILDRKSK